MGEIGAMHVQRPASSGRSQSAKRKARSGASDSRFTLDNTESAASAPQASATSSIAPLNALLAIQEVGNAQEQKEKAIDHGQELLSLLDEIKISLLSGRISQTRIRYLAQAVERRPVFQDDTDLKDLLDQIELRAKVELAKMGR